MELFEAIITRRSIRRFKHDPVTREKINRILDAGMHAPSAHNHQPWYFIVITKKDLLMQIRKFHPYADMLKDAPVAILVCGDNQIEPNPGYLVQDCAAATQNMLLAAHDLELGAVWIGIYPRQERIIKTAEIVHLPDTVLPVSLVAIGIPIEKKDPQERFKPERIYKNSWDINFL